MVPVICLACILVLSNSVAKAKESNVSVISCEDVGNGWKCYISILDSDISAFALSRGYTYYVSYEHDGTLACELKVSVGFDYDNLDGNARINFIDYQITGQYNGYTVGAFAGNYTNGNPAVAKLGFNIYKDGNYLVRMYPTAYCYNNGSANNTK